MRSGSLTPGRLVEIRGLSKWNLPNYKPIVSLVALGLPSGLVVVLVESDEVGTFGQVDRDCCLIRYESGHCFISLVESRAQVSEWLTY